MGINRKDIQREEQTDRKVGVAKDVKRIANGDVKGTLHDNLEELKADFKASDDKVEEAFGGDEDDLDRRSIRPGYRKERSDY